MAPRFNRVMRILVVFIFLMACKTSATVMPGSPTLETSTQATQAVILPTATGTTQAPTGQTSDELIAAALESGTIDALTALKYKVFAQYSDPRLPEEFQGTADLNRDNHILDELQAQFQDLPEDVQKELLPFLAPPIYKGSWADPATRGGVGSAPSAPGEGSNQSGYSPPCNEIDNEHWEFVSAMHSPVRFWWLKDFPESKAAVDRFMTAMDDDVWPKLTALMGRSPLPDGGFTCNGGSPDLDIYVTPLVERSSAPASFPGCKETPAYMLLNPGVSDATLAHEFFHDIQWGYNTSVSCMYPGNYTWLAEATASWSQNYVYPNSNEEHGYVPWFFSSGTKGTSPTLELKNDSHEYGAHLFFFYLTNHFGQPDIVKNTWDYTTAMSSLEAVDKAIPGGFDAAWGDFAVKNVDEPPYDDYQVWDQLNIKPSGGSLTKGQLSPGIWDVAKDIDHLSIKYHWFTFSDDSRLVTFFNGLTYLLDEEPINIMMGTLPINDGTLQYKFTPANSADVDRVKIQAYFKVAGDTDWQLEDWSDKPYVSFCRDAQAEKLTDLIIITSNSSLDQSVSAQGSYNPILSVSDTGCWRYGGEASMLMTGAGEGGSFSDDQQLPSVAFERTEEHPNIPYPYLHFKVAEGEWQRTYHYESTDGDCIGDGETSTSLGKASKFTFGNDLYILYGAISGKSVNRYSGSADAAQPVVPHFTCPDGATDSSILSLPWFYTDVLSQINEEIFTVAKGGALRGSGDLLETVNNATMLYKWNFEPLFESSSSGTSDTGTTPSDQPSTSGNGSSGAPAEPKDAGIVDVPPYPNVETSQQNAGMFMMTTSDARDNVVEFYVKALTDQNWKLLTDPVETINDLTQILFSKGSKMTSIMITESEGFLMVVIYQANQ
jgi:hypothetical protein